MAELPAHLAPALLRQVPDHSKVTVSVGGRRLVWEVVNTEQSRRLGLGGRSDIGSDGMLFVSRPGALPIWMKGMCFDLDLVWLSRGEVVDLERGVPAPRSPRQSLPVYTNHGLADMVLEIASGQASSFGLEVGSRVRFLR